jgi:Fic family protein
MKGDTDYKDLPGELRKIVVWIGGAGHNANSTYNPTPPDDIPACLAETMTYMRCEGLQATVHSLIVRMAIAHSHFEAVHPFRDGNGRVGRLLLPLMMAAERLTPVYLSPYIEAHKQAYYDSLKAAQQRLEWQELIGFVSDAIVATVNELLTTREALRRLGAIRRNRRKFRKASGAERAFDVLPHYPVLTVQTISHRQSHPPLSSIGQNTGPERREPHRERSFSKCASSRSSSEPQLRNSAAGETRR